MAATSPAAPLVDVHLLGWHLLPVGNLFKSGCPRAGWGLVPSVSSEKQTALWDEKCKRLMGDTIRLPCKDLRHCRWLSRCPLCSPKHLPKPFLCLLHCLFTFLFPRGQLDLQGQGLVVCLYFPRIWNVHWLGQLRADSMKWCGWNSG